jgi:hypothetical protein
LNPHTGHNEPLSANFVGQQACSYLCDSPCRRTDGRESSDLLEAHAGAAKINGNKPQVRASLRLFTNPTWLALDRFLSRMVVSQKISDDVGLIEGIDELACDSSEANLLVSRITHIDNSKPRTRNPTPR